MNSKKTNLVGNPIYITDTYIKIFVEDGTVNKTWRHTPAPGTDKSLFPSFSCQHRINRDNSSCYNTSNSALSKLFSTTYGEEMHTSVEFPWFAASFLSYFFRISETFWRLFSGLPISSMSSPISLLWLSPPNFSANSSSNSMVLCNAYKQFSKHTTRH